MRNAQPAIIRSFFSAFAEGVLTVDAERQSGAVEMTPQHVKKVMLNHYEEVSKQFFDILFTPLALLHYDTSEELIALLRSPEIAPTLQTPVDLFRHVCRTEQAHEDMVTEYRRNFSSLLSGRVLSLEEFYDAFPAGYLEDTTVPTEREVRALTQVVVKAFFAGRAVAGSHHSSGTNQVYLFRLLLDGMQSLLHSSPVCMDDDIDLNEAFLTVCRCAENMQVMLREMEACMPT